MYPWTTARSLVAHIPVCDTQPIKAGQVLKEHGLFDPTCCGHQQPYLYNMRRVNHSQDCEPDGQGLDNDPTSSALLGHNSG